MLARFTQIDYDREIALVALGGTEPNEKRLGVARVITDIYNRKNAEFSVVVGDLWQGKGIGYLILTELIKDAREKGYHIMFFPVDRHICYGKEVLYMFYHLNMIHS